MKATREERKYFASAQLEIIKKLGFSSRESERILAAAKPGRAVLAAEWATGLVHGLPWGSPEFDALLFVVGGVLANLKSPHGIGEYRCRQALGALGYPVPELEPRPGGEGNWPIQWSATGLRKFLEGARATLLSMCPFSHREEEEASNGAS